uniref:Nucleoprotein n=1 Tax=Shuangao Insect Virus 3 TaxID=1608077 RepID=A0A2C9NJZ8_9VIRU|nr:nucleocapsid protein [Shuangao Insect Virus 3]
MPRVYFAGNIYDIGASDWSKICKSVLGSTICTTVDLCSKINTVVQKHRNTFESFRKVNFVDSDLVDIPVEVFEKQKSIYSHFWSKARIEQYEDLHDFEEEDSLSNKTLVDPENGPADKKEEQPDPILPLPLQTPTLPLPSTFPGTSGLQVLSGIMDLSKLISSALNTVNAIDINLFNYEGFDPMVIRDLFFKISQEGNGITININGRAFDFHKGNSHNDLNFLVTLGLMRGNQLTKISNKSCKELQTALKAMIHRYKLKEKTDGMSTSLTLMRIVNSFPEIAYSVLQAGRGRDITGLGISVVLANSVSFQMVNRANFRKYAKHFLYVNQKIDRVINKKRKEGFTSLKELWNYLILAYNSPIIPDGKRVGDIGNPLAVDKNHFAISPSEEAIWDQINNKIDTNDPSQI